MLFKKQKVFIFATILILIFSLIPTAFAQYSDVSPNSYYYEAVMNLNEMGIIKGFSDGSFKPSNSVTRAEFVKMMVLAMDKAGDAAALDSGTSVFTDIKPNNWAIGYINVAIKEQIVTGYADGTFQPNENVSFAQVCTVLLRSLGYSSSEMPGVWPQNYIEKAKDLGITGGINLKFSDKVSRAQLAVMLERTLNTKLKDSTQTMAEKSGMGSTKTVIVTNSWDLDSSLPKGIIKTDIGDFKANNFEGLKYIGKKLNVLVDTDNKIISTQSIEVDTNTVFVQSVSGNSITYSGKNGDSSMNIPDNLTFYYDGQKSIFKDIKMNVSTGAVIAFALNTGNAQLYDYAVLIDPPSSDPVVVKKDVGITDKNIGTIDISDKSKVTVIKEGQKAGFSDIKAFDVAYLVKNPYKPGQGVILVYDDKKTGTYDEAIPSKSTVQKIKLLGEEMEIETSNAASKLNDSNEAFAIGDQITVLTGKTGKIVDVISSSPTDISNIAVVVNAGSSISTEDDTSGEKVFYVTLYKTDGTKAEYEVDEDQTYRKGKLVRYDIKEEVADITSITCSPVSGRINASEKMIGDLWLGQDAVILDVQNNYDSKEVQIKRLNWQDMPSGELLKEKVIHAETGGGFNDIQLLVLNNLTESGQYGILMEKSERDTSASYTLMINGEEVTFNNSSTIFGNNKKDVVYIEQDENGLQKMASLNPKDSSNEIQAVDTRRIKINNKIYKLSNNAAVYDITGTEPVKMSVSELTSGNIGYVKLYSGTQTGSQSLIKIITIQRVK